MLPFLHIFWQYRTGGMALFRALVHHNKNETVTVIFEKVIRISGCVQIAIEKSLHLTIIMTENFLLVY